MMITILFKCGVEKVFFNAGKIKDTGDLRHIIFEAENEDGTRVRIQILKEDIVCMTNELE